MGASNFCVDLVAGQEGYLRVHKPDVDGTPTIGFGHQDPGLKFTMLSEAEARELLRADLAYYSQVVSELVTVPLAQHEIDALASLTYNVGRAGLAKSKLRAKLNAGDRAGALLEFDDWHHYRDTKGIVHADANLQRRRAIERDVFEGWTISLALARPGGPSFASRGWRVSPPSGSGSSSPPTAPGSNGTPVASGSSTPPVRAETYGDAYAYVRPEPASVGVEAASLAGVGVLALVGWLVWELAS